MDRKSFLAAFRSLARRYNACLAEVHRVGVDNIGIEVIDEINALHDRFMELASDEVDMNKIFAEVDLDETEKNEFYGQWNRVTKFVLIYEEMFGEDPELLAEAEAWKRN